MARSGGGGERSRRALLARARLLDLASFGADPRDEGREPLPIDFGHDVEAALATVRAIAPATDTAVVLLSALEPKSPPTTLLLPGTSAILREFDRDAIERRLEELASGLRVDVSSVQTVVSDRRPADAIATEVASLAPDLILLVTDAHTRLARWSDPSATQRLLAIPDLVLLLMREP